MVAKARLNISNNRNRLAFSQALKLKNCFVSRSLSAVCLKFFLYILFCVVNFAIERKSGCSREVSEKEMQKRRKKKFKVKFIAFFAKHIPREKEVLHA